MTKDRSPLDDRGLGNEDLDELLDQTERQKAIQRGVQLSAHRAQRNLNLGLTTEELAYRQHRQDLLAMALMLSNSHDDKGASVVHGIIAKLDRDHEEASHV